ncbi:hypothetical protein KAS42_02035 [bacterium]|nr:hypothetical protein [bacterium]
MNRKTSKTIDNIMLVLFMMCLSLHAFAQSSQWTKVEIPNICSFEIPEQMEIQGENYKALTDSLQEKYLKVSPSLDKVLIQQKGLNELNKEAFKLYARIMIETQITPPGEAEALTTPLQFSDSELQEFEELFKQGILEEFKKFSTPMRLLKLEPVQIEKINGIDVITIQYRRQLKQNIPVVVKVYFFNNYDRMHIITMSYRETEAKIWKPLYSKIILSFEFYDRKPVDIKVNNSIANAQGIDSYKNALTTLYGNDWLLTLILSVILTWGVGLTPPLIVRYLIFRRPLSKIASIIFCTIQGFCNLIIFVSLGSESKTHFALFLIALASYYIIHKGWNNVKVSPKR